MGEKAKKVVLIKITSFDFITLNNSKLFLTLLNYIVAKNN